MATSIVLATDDEALREHVELVVDESADLVLAAVVPDLDRLAEALAASDVDVLLLDERMTRVSLRDTVRDASTANPFAGVVVLTPESSERTSAERYAAALEAGARSTISFPSSLDDLRTRVQQAADWGRSLRAHVGGDQGRTSSRGRLVALTGAKGGVGTSVLASLLAREALASAPSVCLVDADLRGGTLGFYADVTARRTLADLAEVASDLTGRSIREVAVEHECGLVLVLAPEEVERAEDLTADVARAVFSHLRSHFDVVVVDCGSDLDEARAMVIELADEVVLVTSTDVVALRAARAALATWERLSVRTPAAVRLVLNRVSRKVEVQPDLVSRVIGLPVAVAVPAAFAALEAPLNAGRLLHAPPAALAPAIAALSAATGLAAPEPAPVRRRARPLRDARPAAGPGEAGPGRGSRRSRSRRSGAPVPAAAAAAVPVTGYLVDEAPLLGAAAPAAQTPAPVQPPLTVLTPPAPPAVPAPPAGAQDDPWAPPVPVPTPGRSRAPRRPARTAPLVPPVPAAPAPPVQRTPPPSAPRPVVDPWAPPSSPSSATAQATTSSGPSDPAPVWNRVDGSGDLIARMGDPRGASPRWAHSPVAPPAEPGTGA